MEEKKAVGALVVRMGAEFLVIVTGVLVALAADGWREDQLDREAEIQYLERLSDDLRADTTALATEVRLLTEKLDGLERPSRAGASWSPVSADSLAAELARATMWSWAFIPTQSITFEEMRSTGSLSLIRDPSVRSAVADYYANYERVVATIEARQPGFNALTYRLVPRPHEASSRRDFSAGPLLAEHRVVLGDSAVLAEVRQAATAERNFSAYSGESALLLQAAGAEVLGRLERYLSR